MPRRKKKQPITPWLLVGALSLFIVGLLLGGSMGITLQPVVDTLTTFLRSLEQPSPTFGKGDGTVYAIDVGQGSSYLIQTGDRAVLIDTGEGEYAETVLAFLKQQGITRLDLVVGTHPHSDHIGGMAYLLERVPVGKVILPKLPESMIPTTKTYRELLETIDRRGLSVVAAAPGQTYDLGGPVLEILGPGSGVNVDTSNNLNDYSVICRFSAGSHRFLFTGDGEKPAEQALLASGQDLRADVLFAGHHGSNTSSAKAFVQAVSPKASALSLGGDNSYGHPHPTITDRLAAYGPVARTDLLGTIAFVMEGERLTMRSQKGEPTVIKAGGGT